MRTTIRLQNTSTTLLAKHLTTPLGPIVAIVDETHLYMLKFADQNTMQKAVSSLQKKFDTKIQEGSNQLLTIIQDELTAYFNGTLHQFSIPTKLYGTDFQQTSWDALTKIPYGATTSYGKQAITIGNPKAFRAVASANRMNPIAIIIPCHRIIKSNGDVCGYNGGIERKKALLDLEKTNSKTFNTSL